MKTIYNNIEKRVRISKSFVMLVLFLSLVACTDKDEDCGYETQCVESCDLIEDFEDDTLDSDANWIGISDNGIYVILDEGSNVLYVLDGSGASWVYNTEDFPSDLIEAGCELNYDIRYLSGGSNGITTDNSISIFQGTSPSSFTLLATFKLNISSLIVSGDPFSTITVPLELATGTTLPSNSFGEWVLSGGASPTTAADVANFNILIQSNNGVAFWLDEGNNPAEKWWYDNFCFKQCCPESILK